MRLPNQNSAALDLNAIAAVRNALQEPLYVPQTPAEIFAFIRARLDQLENDFNRRVKFFAVPFSIGTAIQTLRPEEPRQYLFIQNTHATQILYLGFGYAPTLTTGMQIGPQGFYEPYWTPQNDIQVLGSGANTTGLLLYASTVNTEKA